MCTQEWARDQLLAIDVYRNCYDRQKQTQLDVFTPILEYSSIQVIIATPSSESKRT